jgi:hypothetical protein
MSVRMRQFVERKIADAFLTTALKAGFYVNIDNGGDDLELPKPINDKRAILKAMFAADEDRLYLYKSPDDKKAVGWVYFVYGNDGYDVISDYTVNLGKEKLNLMEAADKLSDFFGGHGSYPEPEDKFIYETIVYDGRDKSFRILNVSTGTVYSTEFKTLEEAVAAVDDGKERAGKTVKLLPLADLRVLLAEENAPLNVPAAS